MGRVAVFGGTFDPVHRGHIEAADIVLEKLSVDGVILVPAGEQPFKKKSTIVMHRLNMLDLALQDRKNISISLVEAGKPGKSYTIDTLDILAQLYTNPILVVGADKLKELPRWKEAKRLLNTYTIAILPRLGYEIDLEIVEKLRREFLADIILVDTEPPMEVSSTQIRNLIAQGEKPLEYITEEVYEYIQKQELYLPNISPEAV